MIGIESTNPETNIDATRIADGSIDNTTFQYLNGVTSNIQSQINAKQASITGAALTIAATNLTASKVLISDSNGKVAISNVTSAELVYLGGVNSSVQTQLDGKQATITGGASTITSNNLTASKALVSDTNGKVSASSVNSTELTYLSGVTSAVQTQLNGKQATITGGASSITTSNLTASKALVSDASGKVTASSVNSAELSYLSGATSNIQTQINNLSTSSVPIGTVFWQAKNTISAGFLECNGTTISRTTYSNLYSAIKLAFAKEFTTDNPIKLLLHFEGADASTVFTEETGKTVTRAGNAQIDTAQKVFGSSSGLFDGSGDYLTVPADPDFNFENDFIIAFRMQLTALSNITILKSVTSNTWTSCVDADWLIGTTADNKLQFAVKNGATITGSTVLSTSTWYAVVIARIGSTIRIFLNGNLEASGTQSGTIGSGQILNVGQAETGFTTSYFKGWMDELMIAKGVGIASNFTIPTNPFTLIDFGLNLLHPANGYNNGDDVTVFSLGTLPAGLTEGTVYYARCQSPDVISLHDTQNNAVTGNAGRINIFDGGAGSHKIWRAATFPIPDLRGEFIRGYDHSRGIDTDRVFGSAQSDQANSLYQVGYSNYVSYSNPVTVPDDSSWSGYLKSALADTGIRFKKTGLETRPRNIALLPCIKY